MQKETANQLINTLGIWHRACVLETHLWGPVWSWVSTAEAAAAAAAAGTGFWSVAAAQGWRRPAPATPSPGPHHPRQYRSRSVTPVSKPRPPLDPRHSAPSAPDVALRADKTHLSEAKRPVSVA